MPRQVESSIAKLLRLADDLTPDEISAGIEILKAAGRRNGKPLVAPRKAPSRRTRLLRPGEVTEGAGQ